MPTFNTILNTKLKFNIFGDKDFSVYSIELINSIKSEITSQTKDYILNVNEEEFINSIESKYKFEPISFDLDNITFPNTEKEEFRDNRGVFVYYNFTMKIPFSGSQIILRLAPSQRFVISYPVYIDHTSTDEKQNFIYTEFKVLGRDKYNFNLEKSNALQQIIANLDNINKEVEKWNNNLKQTIKNIFSNQKNEYLSDNQFFESIDLKVFQNTDSLFNPSLVKKKIIPTPKVNEKSKKFSNSPSIDILIYTDIITTINTVCKSMERKPATYKGKDEEGIRDNILLFLETRYDSTTGTSETFNKSGKTDILLKYKDGTNLFVAECKFWHGEKSFYDAINQLFNYLTWRDSKSALIIFVQNKDFSNVIDTVNECTYKNPLYKSFNTKIDETCIGYKFNFPGDSSKEIYLEIMLFHFPE